MNRMHVVLYIITLLNALFITIGNVNAQLAACKGKFLGNTILSSPATDNAGTTTWGQFWNQVTPENSGKWGSVQNNSDTVYNWSQLDTAYNFAKSNGYLFKFHNFVWGTQQPTFMTNGTLTNAQQAAAVQTWIKAVATRYPNIDMADVVNEPLHTVVPYAAALGGAGTTGWDWVVQVYTWARQYLPNTKLLINEYGIINDPNELAKYLQLINLLKSKGLLDGIGIECHSFNLDALSAATVTANLKLLSAAGLPIYASEMDLTGTDTTQLTEYKTVFPALWSSPYVEGITLWGYVQGLTWENGNGITTGTGGTGSGLINSDGTLRPAMTWLQSYMASLPNVGCDTNHSIKISITPSSTTNFCTGSPITLTAAVTDTIGRIKVVAFYAGDTLLGTVTAPPYVYTWTNATTGIHTFMAQVTDSSNANATSKPVTITVTISNSAPPPTATSPVDYCQNTVATALTATGASLKWYTTAMGVVASTNAPLPRTTNVGATNYYVTQTINSCESAKKTVTVIVNSIPTAAINSLSSASFCEGDSLTLTANIGTGLTYQWNKNGVAINVANSSSYTVSSAGTYSVTVKNSYTCTNTSAGKSLSIDSLPTTSKAGNNQYITSTTANLFANTPAIGSGKWALVSGRGSITNLTSSNSSVSGLETGANILEWTISNGSCPTSSSVTTIYVGNAPIMQTIIGQANVIAGEIGITYTLTSDSGSHYSWSLPSGATISSSNSDSSRITVSFGSEGGTVSVTETNLFGSATSSLAVSINDATGIISGTATDNYVISPNPFSDHTTIVVHSELTKPIMLSVVDIQGILCDSYSQYYTNEEFTLGNKLANGIYFVRISYGNLSKVFKLVKVN